MKIFELVHNVKNAMPGVALVMIVAVKWYETADDARFLAAAKHGLEVPNAWLDPAATSCKLINWSLWTTVPRGVRCVQKAE